MISSIAPVLQRSSSQVFVTALKLKASLLETLVILNTFISIVADYCLIAKFLLLHTAFARVSCRIMATNVARNASSTSAGQRDSY